MVSASAYTTRFLLFPAPLKERLLFDICVNGGTIPIGVFIILDAFNREFDLAEVIYLFIYGILILITGFSLLWHAVHFKLEDIYGVDIYCISVFTTLTGVLLLANFIMIFIANYLSIIIEKLEKCINCRVHSGTS